LLNHDYSLYQGQENEGDQMKPNLADLVELSDIFHKIEIGELTYDAAKLAVQAFTPAQQELFEQIAPHFLDPDCCGWLDEIIPNPKVDGPE